MAAVEDRPTFPTSDDDDLDVVEQPRPASPSLIEVLKAQRAKLSDERTFDLLVPGYGELLVLRLGPISADQQARLAERIQRGRNTRNASVDTLVTAFRSLLARPTPTAALEQLVDDEGDPLGLDDRLAEKLDLGPVRTARDVLEALFRGANSPTLAITAAASEFFDWGASAGEEIDEDFLGES
jgi:hypothetical protein